MLLTWLHVRMKELNRSYLEHFLAEKVGLSHARVGIKRIYDSFLKAVLTCILVENLGDK